jgi:hypothetical protein
MTVAQSNRHSKTSGEVVNEKKRGVILTAPTGCWVEIRMKYQTKKTGVRSQESLASPQLSAFEQAGKGTGVLCILNFRFWISD